MKVCEEISALSPYVPGQPISEIRRNYGVQDVAKLASNENPLGPSPKALEAMRQAINDIHLYPDGSTFELKRAIADHYRIPQDRILLGAGSDECIDLLIRTYAERGNSIIASPYGFNAYRIRAQASRVKTVHPPMIDRFRIDLDKVKDVWNPSIRFIFLDNPNNPTGVFYKKSQLTKFMKDFCGRDDVFVVFDEAYTEFIREPDKIDALEEFRKYNNVIVLRTFSKVFSMAGVRLGVMFANPEVVSYCNRVRLPFNINSIVQAGALAALRDGVHIEKSVQLAWDGLDYFYKELDRLGLPYIKSEGNFVMFDTLREAEAVHQELLKRGIILRPLRSYGLTREIRMSIGHPHENRRAIKALEEVLKVVPRA